MSNLQTTFLLTKSASTADLQNSNKLLAMFLQTKPPRVSDFPANTLFTNPEKVRVLNCLFNDKSFKTLITSLKSFFCSSCFVENF